MSLLPNLFTFQIKVDLVRMFSGLVHENTEFTKIQRSLFSGHKTRCSDRSLWVSGGCHPAGWIAAVLAKQPDLGEASA